MATINLGAIKFNWKGPYNSSTTYAVDDVVSSGGNSYVCIQAHSNQAVGNATAYWNIMSSAGTNGTDGTNVATTITTQGDILYRDGSGLQRLPKGTAGQVLQMNSGATAPEYGTVSSDFVKLAHQTLDSTGLASVEFQNCFSSTNDGIYGAYYLRVDCQKTGSTSSNVEMQLMTGTNTPITSVNRFAGMEAYRQVDNNASNTVGTSSDADGRDAFYLDGWGFNTFADQREGNSAVVQFGSDIYGGTSRARNFMIQTLARDFTSNNYLAHKSMGGRTETTSNITGIKVFLDNDNMHNGAITLWGMKK